MANSSKGRRLRHTAVKNRGRGASRTKPSATSIVEKVAASSAERTKSAAAGSAQYSRSLEAASGLIFNASARAADHAFSALQNTMRSILKDVANPRPSISRTMNVGDLLSDLRLGMRPLENFDLTIPARSVFATVEPDRRDLGIFVLDRLAAGEGVDAIADDLRMDVDSVQQSILKQRAEASLIRRSSAHDLQYAFPAEVSTGGVGQAGVEEQFSTIVSRFDEPALKSSTAQSAAPAATPPNTPRAGSADESGRDRPEMEQKVPTRSGRPVHPDTQRELARIYVEAREEAGLSVPDDVRKLAFGS